MRPHGFRRHVLLALVALAPAGCPQEPTPSPDRVVLAGLDVALADGGVALVVSEGGRARQRVDLASLSVGAARASFEMQFGMFAIEEGSDGERRTGATATVTDAALGLTLRVGGADDPLAVVAVRGLEDGHLVVEVTPADPAHNRVALDVACAADEHFAGFGAQSADVDHRGQRVPLWVSEQGVGKTDDDELPLVWQVVGRRHTTHVPSPTWVSSAGVAYVLDTTAYASVDVCAARDDAVGLEVWAPKLVLHLFFADTPLAALAQMSAFVGRPRVPPPWAFAPWNDAVRGEDAVRAFAEFLRAEHIPTSALWSEDWRGGLQSGDLYRLEEDWRLDRALYPNYEDMVADLEAMGIHHQVYFNTFLTETADIFDETAGAGLAIHDDTGAPYLFDGADAAFSPTGLLDLTNDEARAYMRGHLEGALAAGARGWMADFAEWMPVNNAVLASGEDPALMHNVYPVLWSVLNDDVVRASGLEDEVCVYHRSGHLYSQRSVQIMWAGDQRTAFHDDDGLPTIIPIGLGLAASGFFFYAHDIAGYQSSTNPTTTKELFFRWTTLGALTPVMRTHHGTHAGLNWSLDRDAETTAHWKRWAERHVMLYPYLRALAHRAVDEGRPLWIPLGLAYPDDADAWAVKDAFLLGDALLVAPVVDEGALARAVYVPAGRFAPFLDPLVVDGGDVASLEGPQTVDIDAPLTELPMLVRQGGIVPLLATPVETLVPGIAGIPDLDDTEGDRLVVIGLGADGAFTEESGARYTLTGVGTDRSGLVVDDDGAVVLTGDATVSGGGFTLVLEGHPADRVTRVLFR